MKKQELLNLNFQEGKPLWNWHQYYQHELFTLLFIEKDGELEVDRDDANRLRIVKQFEENERSNIKHLGNWVKILNYNPDSKKHLPANIK